LWDYRQKTCLRHVRIGNGFGVVPPMFRTNPPKLAPVPRKTQGTFAAGAVRDPTTIPGVLLKGDESESRTRDGWRYRQKHHHERCARDADSSTFS
jgi:hypothetical protein